MKKSLVETELITGQAGLYDGSNFFFLRKAACESCYDNA